MDKSKVDFIADLLTSKRLDSANKERFFALALDEIKKHGQYDELRKEIEEIKGIINSKKYLLQPISEYNAPNEPRIFKAVFEGREQIIIADGETKNVIPFFNKNTKELIIELPCVVYYRKGIIIGKIVDETFGPDSAELIRSLEKKLTEKLKIELERFKNENKLTGAPKNESHLLNQNSDRENENVSLGDKVISLNPAAGHRTNENLNRKLPIHHRPKELVELLSKFSENNNPLKYSSHSWDYGQVEGKFENYFEFIKQLETEGKPICFEIQRIKKQLGTKILSFLFSDKLGEAWIDENGRNQIYKWGEHGIKIGWKSKELTVWAEANITKDPFEYPIRDKFIIDSHEISNFGQVVSLFKKEIEIRKEDNQLKGIMVELKKRHLRLDFKVKYLSLEGKQFYTDVHYFKRALNKIFIEIGKRTMFPNVEISALDDTINKFTEVAILHKESFCTEIDSESMLTEINDGDFGSILDYLENLCDWSIESSFKDGSYRINFLASDNNIQVKEPINKAQGFKHIFRFYKK